MDPAGPPISFDLAADVETLSKMRNTYLWNSSIKDATVPNSVSEIRPTPQQPDNEQPEGKGTNSKFCLTNRIGPVETMGKLISLEAGTWARKTQGRETDWDTLPS
jgi:hypothetical protein